MNSLIKQSAVQLSQDAIIINGASEIVMCSSLFYFRIPRALWRERLTQVKQMGYNCIDVYFPWNFHETKQGQWDFSGEKDIEAFLQEVVSVGLWVVARPGPYICSEWDGGALPSYLFTIEQLRLRDNEPLFLHHVSRWYEQIIPILHKFQLDQGGTIITIQLENELDFYDCQDPEGYIAALRDMALAHQITVPLIACAGQGGLYKASGFAEGVVPTCNFYPNDLDPTFEEKVLAYYHELQTRKLPLLVTETNRKHFLLRRLLSCGTKLLGPYLQTSGTNFGFTNAANNWGKPHAFLTSDYDFAGAISPEGHFREEAHEGRLLRHAILAYGDSLAEAKPEKAEKSLLELRNSTAKSSVLGPFSLGLKRGGHLLFLTHVGAKDETLTIKHQGKVFPRFSQLIAAAKRSPMLPVAVPLQTWGMEGTLVYATAELAIVKQFAAKTFMVFHTEHEAEISLIFNSAVQLVTNGMKIHESKALITVTFTPDKYSTAVIRLNNGHLLELVGINRAQALLMGGLDEDGQLITMNLIHPPQEIRQVKMDWKLSPINHLSSLSGDKVSLGDRADYLEKHQIYKGYAWYESLMTIPVDKTCQGIILQNASDAVSLYVDGTYLGTAATAGGSHFIAGPTSMRANSNWMARTEIWGHTNFDDSRLPALRLNALKGLTGLVAVTAIRDLTSNWRFQHVSNREVNLEWIKPSCQDQTWPVVGWGGWMSTDFPAFEYYRKQINTSLDADSWTLHFRGLQVLVEAYINGNRAGWINPMNPYLDISPWLEAGQPISLALFMERGFGLPAGNVLLYEGHTAKQWTLSSCQEKELVLHSDNVRSDAMAVELPAELEPGQMAWLYGSIQDSNENKGWRVFCSGSHMKLSVFFNGYLVGRLWLGEGASRPAFSGGSQESFYLPGPWFKETNNQLAIMLEAVEIGEQAVLDTLQFMPV